MKRPWMPLYVADYLADTGHLSTIEHGAYLLLIMHYWQQGGLPDNERKLARICRLDWADWMTAKETLQGFFQTGWKHPRIEAEIAHATDIIAKRTAAAHARYSKSNANGHANAEQMKTQPQPQPPVLSSQASPSKKRTLSLRSSVRAGPEYPELFGYVWESYPRVPNQSKSEALKAFNRLTEKDQQACLDGALAYSEWLARERAKRADTPAAHLATFINQRRFETLNEERARA